MWSEQKLQLIILEIFRYISRFALGNLVIKPPLIKYIKIFKKCDKNYKFFSFLENRF